VVAVYFVVHNSQVRRCDVEFLNECRSDAALSGITVRYCRYRVLMMPRGFASGTSA
jgi:DNA-directed RNA polymerase subunit RPC12/RpoP